MAAETGVVPRWSRTGAGDRHPSASWTPSRVAERRVLVLFGVLVALLLTAFPWVTADGGGESTPVNAGKLALLLAAAAAALWLCELRIPPLGHLLVCGYAAVTAFSALVAGDPAAVVRSVRLALVVVVVAWAARQLGEAPVLRAIAGVAGAVAGTTLLARAVGLPVIAADGRLNGFLPPMHPNILGALCSLGLIALVTLWLEEETGSWWLLLAPLFVLVVVGTGSRTSLLAGAVGVAVVLASAAWRGRPRALNLLLWLVACTAVVLAGASSASLRAAVSAVLTRGGTAVIDPTFTGRTFVWAQAAQFNATALERLVGNGLSVKALPRWLGDRYELQGIDSAWFSAWVAGGALGLGLLSAALLFWLVRSATASAPALALTLAVAIASPTESNLADVSYSLVVVLAATAALTRRRHRPAASGATRAGDPSTAAPRLDRWVGAGPRASAAGNWAATSTRPPSTWTADASRTRPRPR